MFKETGFYFGGKLFFFFSPRCLFFNTGLYKSGLQPTACRIRLWAQDILIRYAFASRCRSWMLSLRPIFCQQCELINLSCCKMNQFHLVTAKLLDLMGGKKTSLERDWEGSQMTSVWWLGHWGGWHWVFLNHSSQLGTTGFIQTHLSNVVRWFCCCDIVCRVGMLPPSGCFLCGPEGEVHTEHSCPMALLGGLWVRRCFLYK